MPVRSAGKGSRLARSSRLLPPLETPSALKPALDRLYRDFCDASLVADPVNIVRRYRDAADREVAGFCAAALAFGRVASVLRSIEALLGPMGASPAACVRSFDPARDGGWVKALGHRWTRGVDLAALLWVLRQMLDQAGSVEGFFGRGHDASADDVAGALESFASRARGLDVRRVYGRAPGTPGVWYFFPRPSDGSACKRLNLFLRWMVRRDGIDLGIWSAVSPSQLVVPLDTHVIRVGRCLRLTRYASPGWRMAVEITRALRRLDPDDPVRYDFSLCHLGMLNACGFRRSGRDSKCPLRGVCRPADRTRRQSRAPSARR